MRLLQRAAFAAAMMLTILIPDALNAQNAANRKSAQAAAAFIDAMDAGDFAKVAAMAAPAVASYFTAEKMTPVWKQISGGARVGAAKIVSVTKANGVDAVDMSVTFTAAPLRLRVAVDTAGLIHGFFVLPSEPPAYHVPPYVDSTKVEEIAMRISGGGILMPAILTLPKGVENAPVVVLVAGSGPNDKDESIGPNRPFKDIAWGLASRGIASLRYDKRTHAGAGHLSHNITVEQEVIEDALTALDSARNNAHVDPMRSFLLGHSLGAMLAPEIAARDSGLAGVVLLAGTPRKLADVMVDQFTYLKTVKENQNTAMQKTLDDTQKEIERLTRREPKPDDLIMGSAPASYFYDLDARDGMAFAKSLKIPMLFLQGGRDYQVLPKDLDLWKKGLAGHRNAQFKLYPDVNHLFMTGTGMATPSEYNHEGHVKADVIEDIAHFISGSPALHRR
jgi:dienelactone hydrolase